MVRIIFSFILALGLPSAFGVELVGQPTIAASASNAVVHWVTDVAAGTRVQVSPNATVAADKIPVTQHTATLTGLPPEVKQLRMWVTDEKRGMQEGERIPVTGGKAQFTLDATSYVTLIGNS